MAGEDETGSEAAPKHTFETASPYYNKPATLPYRGLSTIEGEPVKQPVIDAAMADAQPTGSAKPDAASQTKGAAFSAPVSVSPPPSRGLSLVAVLIAAIVGAVAGFASAYFSRHFLDNSQASLAALDQRLTATNTKLATDEKKSEAASKTEAPIASNNANALSAIEQRLGAVEKSAHDALAAATAAQTQSGQAPQAATAQAPATQTEPGDPQTPSAVPVAAPMPMPDLTPLQSRIDGLEQHLAQLETTVNKPKATERATQEPESKPEPQIANAPSIAIIAENLVGKIAGGAPYAAEITSLDKLGVDKAKLAPLQPTAATGIATTRALSDQLTALSPTLLGTDKPAAPKPEGFAAQLMSHATGLVHVSKVGDVSGNDLSARIARVQGALAHDDIDQALKEWATFPDAAKAASASWAEAAKAHVTALAGAKTIVSDAIANLAKVKS